MPKKLFNLIFEEEAVTPTTQLPQVAPLGLVSPDQTILPQNISLDQKVDHYLIQYERESMPTGTGLTPSGLPANLTEILFEADDDVGADVPDFSDDTGGGEAPEKQMSAPTPTINLNNFAGKLARLINNYESLLNPRTIILNRAQAYITKNYNNQMATELMVIMQTQFGIQPQLLSQQQQRTPTTPIATGAAGNLVGGGG